MSPPPRTGGPTAALASVTPGGGSEREPLSSPRFRVDRTLVGAEQPSREQAGDPVHRWQLLVGFEIEDGQRDCGVLVVTAKAPADRARPSGADRR